MSRYGYFMCLDCKVIFWLGKAVFREDDSIYYYHQGEEETPSNSQNPTLSRTLWKMLADHHLHQLRVMLDDDEDFDKEMAEHENYEEGDYYKKIGGDRTIDISFEDYLRDWPG